MEKTSSGFFGHVRLCTPWRQKNRTDPASNRYFRQSRGMRGPIATLSYTLYRPTFSDKRRKSFHQQPPFCAGETEKNFGICRVNFLFFLTSFNHKLYHSVYFKVLSEIVLFDSVNKFHKVAKIWWYCFHLLC